MLTVWTISNFKSIREPITLDLAPLTIFSGINSSGKSTLIQSILMVAQSFMSVVDDEALILNGRFLQLGRLQDILHFDYQDQPIKVAFDWLPADEFLKKEDALVIHVEAQINKEQPREIRGKSTDKLHPYVNNAKFAFGLVTELRKDPQNAKKKMKRIEVKAADKTGLPGLDSLPADIQSQVKNGAFNYQLTYPYPTSLIQDPRLEKFQRVALSNILPSRILVSVDQELAQLIDDTEWIIDLLSQVSRPGRTDPQISKSTPLSPRLNDVFSLITNVSGNEMKEFRHSIVTRGSKLSRGWVFRQLTGRKPAGMDIFREKLAAALAEYLLEHPPQSPEKTPSTYEERLLPAEYLSPITQIETLFRKKIYYLGPLREDPHVIYETPPLSEQWDVGIKGEYTAAMLDEYRNMKIAYPLPPGSNFSGHYLSQKGTLIEAVTLWLQRMGLVDSVDTRETPKVGYRLIVNSPNLDMPLDLTSVGVGVSQVLPTLVMALLSPPDSVLIFEQPELHLHPKVQSVLADFFLGISQMGKQCLVETHSEHLINRLRRRIVESDENTVLPKTRIYFAQKEGAVSHFTQVKPNEFGTILEWPKGFFDEAENEASLILKLQMEKRRRIREQAIQQQEGK